MSFADDRDHSNREAYREELKREARWWRTTLSDTSLDDVLDDGARDDRDGRCARWCGFSRCKDDEGRVECEREGA